MIASINDDFDFGGSHQVHPVVFKGSTRFCGKLVCTRGKEIVGGLQRIHFLFHYAVIIPKRARTAEYQWRAYHFVKDFDKGYWSDLLYERATVIENIGGLDHIFETA